MSARARPSLRAARWLGWSCAVVALPVPLLAYAPFTGAVFLSLPLLLPAAWAAWHGAWGAGLATLALCALGWFSSPITTQALASLPWASAWLVLDVMLMMLAIRRGRRLHRTSGHCG